MGKRGRNRQRTAVARRQPPAARNDPLTVVQQQIQQQVVAQSWRGPIPDPDSLAKYKDIDPNLPDRIVAMAERTLELTERQTNHRIAVERRLLFGMDFRAHAGLWLAFILAVVVLLGSFWLIHDGHDAAGASIAGIDLVGLASVFVYGRFDQARQEDKRTN